MFEEFGRHDGADRMRPEVIGSGVAVPVAIEPGQRLQAADLQGIAEDVVLLHPSTLGKEPVVRHLRPTPVRWRTVIAASLVGALLLVGVQPASATTALQDARQVRSELVRLTDAYAAKYASRVSPSERVELESMASQARRELTGVVVAVRKAQRTNKGVHWDDAVARHRSARQKAEANFARAQEILGPRLSLVEQWSAFTDYSEAMRSFDDLGDRISR